jgi:nitroreductase
MTAQVDHIATPVRDALWRVKTRLQFTGWLQYLPNLFAVIVCFCLALLGWLAGVRFALWVWPPLGLGLVLLLNLVVDVITLKFGVRPSEPLPKPKDDVDAFDLMRARRSCRSFQQRDLIPAHRSQLINAARIHTAPSSLIGERAIRFEYVAAPLTVWPVVGAREFFVAIAPREYHRLAVIDVGRSLQKVVLEATRMGVATCWIGPGADHVSLVKHLGDRFDPERDHIVCVLALGYASVLLPLTVRLMIRAQRRRLPLSSLFFADSGLEQPLDPESEPFRQFGRCYEVCQWSPSSFNGQPTRCAAVVTSDGNRLERFDFFASTTSRFYAPVALGIWCANWETGCNALGLAGRFSVLPVEERGVEESADPPRYDVSWVREAGLVPAQGAKK